MKIFRCFLVAAGTSLALGAAAKSGPACNVTSAAMGRIATTDPWEFKATVKSRDLAAGQSCDKLELATDEGRILHTEPLSGDGEVKFKLASIPEGVAVIHVRAVSKPASAAGRASKLKVPGAKKRN